MSCSYLYNGKQYSKEELVDLLSNPNTSGVPFTGLMRSVAVAQNESKLTTSTRKMLSQRISDLRDLIQSIQNSDDSAESKLKKIAFYNKRIESAIANRTELKDADSSEHLSFVLSMAEIDASTVESIYNGDTMSTSELHYAKNVVDVWSSLRNVLEISNLSSIEDPELKQRLRDIHSTYNELSELTLDLAKGLLVNSNRGPKVTMDDANKLIDINMATEYVRPLSVAGSGLGNKLAYIINETNAKVNQDHANSYHEADHMLSTIKDHPLFKKSGYDLFLKHQTTKNGTNLGLVTKFSQTYWDNFIKARRKLTKDLMEAGDNRTMTKEARNRYNNWVNEHTVSFNSLPFLLQEKYTDEDREKEVDYMKSLGFNQHEIDDIIKESANLLIKFDTKKKEYEASMQLEILENPGAKKTDETEDEFVQRKVDEWDNLHDPLKYLEQKFNTKNISAYEGSRYVYQFPKKEVKGKATDYYDSKFQAISEDPKLYAYYSWFKNTINDSLRWLPQEDSSGLGSNFLPVIASRAAQEYGFNLKESMKGVGDWFMKSLTIADFFSESEKDAFTNKERRKFRTRFLRGDVNIEDRSTDLTTMAKIFSDMALVYKHKNTVKAEVDLINDIFQQTKGSYKRNNRLGTIEKVDKDATHLQGLVEYTVRKTFYGIKNKEDLYKSERQFYDWKELVTLGLYRSPQAKQAKELEGKIKGLNEELDQPHTEQELEDLEHQIDLLKDQYYKLGGRKFSVSKTIDSSISLTRTSSLAFSPFASVRNLLVGKLNNVIHAAGGRDFTKKELLWANKFILDSSGKYFSGGKYETRNTKLLFGLMADSQLAEGEDGIYLRTLVDKHTALDKVREMLPQAFTWLASGDYHFKAEMLVAAMKFEKVETSRGLVPFIDVLTENRGYNEKEYGPWDAEKNGGKAFEDFYLNRMLKYRQIASKLHGISGKNADLKIKDSAVGRALLLFKSWLPETIGARFDSRYHDAMTDRDEQGFYVSFFKVVQQKKWQTLKLMMQATLGKKNLDIKDELLMSNFKKAVKELQVILTLVTAFVLLKAMAPDDDEDKKMYNLLVLRQLRDLRRDMTYYFDVSSINELQHDIFPMFRTMVAWGDAMKAVSYHTMGIQGNDGNDMYDSERTALKITKILPIMNNVNRVLYFQKQLN